jgi:hypothetical protein
MLRSDIFVRPENMNERDFQLERITWDYDDIIEIMRK